MPYPYQQISNYAAGDYYRMPYAAGGLFSFLGKAVSTVTGIASKVLPGPLGAAAKVVSGITAPKGTSIVPMNGGGTPLRIPQLPFGPQLPVPAGTPGAQPVPGVGGTIQRILPGGASGYMAGMAPSGYHMNKSYSYAKGLPAGSFPVRNRSMNPGNAKALRRAIRREAAFVGLAKRVLKGSGYTFKRTGVARKTVRRKR